MSNRKKGRRSERRMIRLSDVELPEDATLIPGMPEALARVYAGEIVPEQRRVVVGDLVVRDDDVSAAGLAICRDIVTHEPPATLRIPAVVLADGRLWAFDDAHMVRACQELAPDLVADVAIIPLPTSDA